MSSLVGVFASVHDCDKSMFSITVRAIFFFRTIIYYPTMCIERKSIRAKIGCRREIYFRQTRLHFYVDFYSSFFKTTHCTLSQASNTPRGFRTQFPAVKKAYTADNKLSRGNNAKAVFPRFTCKPAKKKRNY